MRLIEKELEDTKGVIRICKSKNTKVKRKSTKEQTTIHKTIHIKME
jgi:hypothetical protein